MSHSNISHSEWITHNSTYSNNSPNPIHRLKATEQAITHSILYDDQWGPVKAERKRILSNTPKPCPSDFPWPEEWHWAQFSLTPCQSVIIQKNKQKKTFKK